MDYIFMIIVYVYILWITKSQYKRNMYISFYEWLKMKLNLYMLWYLYAIIMMSVPIIFITVRLKGLGYFKGMPAEISLMVFCAMVGGLVWVSVSKKKIRLVIKFESEIEIFLQSTLLFCYAYGEELVFRFYGNVAFENINWIWRQVVLGVLFCGVHYFSDISQINNGNKFAFPKNMKLYMAHFIYEFAVHCFLYIIFLWSNSFVLIVIIHFGYNFICNIKCNIKCNINENIAKR